MTEPQSLLDRLRRLDKQPWKVREVEPAFGKPYTRVDVVETVLVDALLAVLLLMLLAIVALVVAVVITTIRGSRGR